MNYNFLVTIRELINRKDLFNLDTISHNVSIYINMDKSFFNFDEYGLNILSSHIGNMLIYPIIIMDLIHILNVPVLEIGNFQSSNNFTCNRFLESSKSMIEHIVNSNNSINSANTVFCRPSGNGSLVYTNSNCFNRGYWVHMSYLIYIYCKAHLAHYIALIFMLVTYLFSNMFSIFISSNRFSLYLFLLMLQSKLVGATNIILANKMISGLVWFFYINGMGWFDICFKNIQSTHVNQTLIMDGRINFRFLRERLYLGGLFLIVINAGVLFSSSLAYVTIPLLNIHNKIIATISSYVISTLASTGWLYITRREVLGYSLYALSLSYIRAFFESVAFNALSYANFVVWSLLPQTFTTYLTTFLIGLLSYIIASFFQIMLETDLNHIVLYGFIYNFVFTSLSISSSGLYFLMNIPNMLLPLKLTLMVLCGTIIIFLPLEVYRFPPHVILGEMGNNRPLLVYLIGRERAGSHMARYSVGMLYQLIVFFAFAIGTFIWLDATGLGG